MKSLIVLPVEFNIFAILPVDGHLGCPYLDQRLLLLKVVASKPANFAKPEQDIFCSKAKLSMACQISLCVILISFLCDRFALYFISWEFILSLFYAMGF